jgi:uroporphyrinogen III methyltransferase/synthase
MAPSNAPLSGKRILITRAREQSAEFSTLLQSLGAEVVEFPTIQIVPPHDWGPLDRAIAQMELYDWLIFTSANGVLFFWQRLLEGGRTCLPPSIKVCAIGPATAKQLRERGIEVNYVPEAYVAEAILEGFKDRDLDGKRILLARAEVARDVLPRGLRQMGAEVDVVEAYRTVKPKGGARRLRELLAKGEVDVVTFTSSSTVSHFVALLKREELERLLDGVIIACIGPITSETAKRWGMEVQIEPREYTIPGLAKAIADYFSQRSEGAKPSSKR